MSLNLVLKKRVFFNKIPFLQKAFHVHLWKGMTSFLSRNLSLIGNQLDHRTNMFCLIDPTLAMSRTLSAFVL